MGYDVWKTLFTDDFDCNKYLYHYTNVDKAIKIICSEQLIFSPITNTNDPTESKLRLVYDCVRSPDVDRKINTVNTYFKNNYHCIRLISFSQDRQLSNEERAFSVDVHNNHIRDKYYDITGRGFALPRMWAQYASNNEGVCFIINKDIFNKKISEYATYCGKPVTYGAFFPCSKIDEKQLELLHNKISAGQFVLYDLIKEDNFFVDYEFFYKLNDWENECEFRYITLLNSEETVFSIKQLFDFVEGIVIGEKILPAYETVISKLVDNRCKIKKIFFNSQICKVE